MKSYEIVVIGAGLSGVICALELKKAKRNVLLIDANERIGKKLLVSGNGKCNILNSNASCSNYNNNFLDSAFKKYSISDLKKYLNNLGLLLREDEVGRIYPYSESANTVLNILIENIEQVKLEVLTSCKVERIDKNINFILFTTKGQIAADKVVLATGSSATFGISSYALLGPYGHKTTKTVQTLVPIKSSQIKGCSGVRAKVKASLYINGKQAYSNNGEMLFKDGGLSGIISLQLSTYISRSIVKGEYKESYVEIDFMPQMSEDDLRRYIYSYGQSGILHKSILKLLEKEKDIAHAMKHFKAKVDGLQNVSQAQLMAGGLDVKDFNNETFESKKQKGLYAIGEVLDVDGECGGYNLTAAMLMGLMCSQGIINENKS